MEVAQDVFADGVDNMAHVRHTEYFSFHTVRSAWDSSSIFLVCLDTSSTIDLEVHAL